jgi:ribonuclease T2
MGLLLLTPVAQAFEPVRGQFLVRQNCPATPSIQRGAMEADAVRKGSRYAALGLNRPGGDFVQIRMPGLKPELRWVSLACGELQTGSVPEDAEHQATGRGGKSRKLLLAMSWQPAFCESRPDKVECRTQTDGRFDADHLTLHGLWPQPQGLEYCGVAERDRSTTYGGAGTPCRNRR